MDPGTIINIVQVCYTAGAKIVQVCSAWKNAEKEIKERVVIVESCWNRTRLQVDFMRRIASTIDDELGRVLEDILGQLAPRLSLAVTKLESVLKKESEARPGFPGFPSKVRRTKYVLRKDTLDVIIGDLEDWQRRFDPSWFLLMKVASPVIDQELAKAKVEAVPKVEAVAGGSRLPANPRSPLAQADGLRGVLRPQLEQRHSVFLPQEPLDIIEIPFSNAKAAQRQRSSDKKWFIVDSIACRPSANVESLTRDVRQLATRLSQADPLTFGLLQCKGVMRIAAPTPSRHVSSFDLIFRAPDGMEVLQSLRQVLLNSSEHISLSRKLRIAKELAKSVSYVHTFDFVHKNIRPESILLFEDTESSRSSTFLVGFDSFRSADGGTNLIGDLGWDRNVYRHPLRQGEYPAEEYKMQHDIYSLGVCLLELGLWESFVAYTEETRPQPKLGESYSRFEQWLKTSGEVPMQKASRNGAFLDAMAFKLKDYLVDTAKTSLPPRMGDKYTQVVVSCLTCLDENSEDFGDASEMIDEDDMLVAVRFIENILLHLEKIWI